MARLGGDAELPELLLDFVHEAEDAGADRTEVVVLELLALRARRAEERAARHHEVRTLGVELLVDEEVFLLRPERDRDALIALAEALHQALRGGGERLHRTQQRRLLVEGLARVGAEGRGDAERGTVRMALDERGGGRIPGRVATGLERGADAARGEARGIGLTDNQILAGEGENRLAVLDLEERVVLLGRGAGERKEPVRVVRGTAVQRPMLHAMRDFGRDRRIERRGTLDRRKKRLGGILRKIFLNCFGAEHVGPEIGCFASFFVHGCVPFTVTTTDT